MQIDLNEYERNVTMELGRLANENLKLKSLIVAKDEEIKFLKEELKKGDDDGDR